MSDRQASSAATGRESIIRVWEGEPLPEWKSAVRILATEDIPWGGGTATRRSYSVLVRDTRYWLTDHQIAEEAGMAQADRSADTESRS